MWRRTEIFEMEDLGRPAIAATTGMNPGTGFRVLRPTSGGVPYSEAWEVDDPSEMKSPPRDGMRPWTELLLPEPELGTAPAGRGARPGHIAAPGDRQIIAPAGYGPRWIWEPNISMQAMNIYDASLSPNGPTDDTGIEMQAFFVSYRVWREIRERTPLRAQFDALLATPEKAQLVAFRAGDAGRRVVYDTNFARGHMPPREHVSDDKCVSKNNGYWPLVYTWARITDDTPDTVGRISVDWEWRPRSY